MKAIPTKVDNVDSLSALEFNPNSDELENAVTKSGQALDEADTNQLGTAVSNYASGGGDFYDDVGIINSYTLSPVDPGGQFDFQHPEEYFEGMSIQCVANTSSTGASQINVNTIGAVDLKDTVGGVLVANSIIGGTKFSARFDTAAGEFRLDPAGQGNVTGTGSSTVNEIMVANNGTATAIKGSGIPVSDIGKVLQILFLSSSDVVTTTNSIPDDNTPPQNTEGLEALVLAITPKSSISKIIVEASTWGSTTTDDISMTLFKDAISDALTVSNSAHPGVGMGGSLNIGYSETSGSLVARVFKVRFGSGAGTSALHRNRLLFTLGSIPKSFIKITEVLP